MKNFIFYLLSFIPTQLFSYRRIIYRDSASCLPVGRRIAFTFYLLTFIFYPDTIILLPSNNLSGLSFLPAGRQAPRF